MQFGEIIKEAREKNLLSQEDAARQIEKTYAIRLSASYLSMIESGTRTNITVKVLRSLLHFYKLPLSAAGSLFSQADAGQTKIAEAATPYRLDPLLIRAEHLAALPAEARHTLQDFIAFILARYGVVK